LLKQLYDRIELTSQHSKRLPSRYKQNPLNTNVEL